MGEVSQSTINLFFSSMFLYRSVHNIRIECLWVDFTAGVGAKWKNFFEELEVQSDLDPNLPSHIWLLHHLFLDKLNQDITDWANTWNNHKMHIPGVGTRSPTDLRWFSMLQDGARGFVPSESAAQHFEPLEDTVPPDEVAEYGVDWDAYHDRQIHDHHSANNSADTFAENPFISHYPDNFNVVDVQESRCPFTLEELNLFTHNLSLLPESLRFSRELPSLKQLWILALEICKQIKE